jgi:multidrug resistance efflux pump
MDALAKDNIESGSPLQSYEEPPPLSKAPIKDGKAKVSPAKPPVLTKKRTIVFALALVAFCGAAAYGCHWWTVGRFLETTDDAYLQADKVVVSPRITGYVAEVLVGDNQPVKAGDVIARLDDHEYRIMLKQEEADAAKDKAQLEAVAAAIIQQLAQVEAARADVVNTEAALTFASQEFSRYQDLMQSGAGCNKPMPTCASGAPRATRQKRLSTPHKNRSKASRHSPIAQGQRLRARKPRLTGQDSISTTQRSRPRSAVWLQTVHCVQASMFRPERTF